MSLHVRPFLMFQGEADAAITLYTTVFPEAAVDVIARHGPEAGDKAGTVMRATFTIGGQSVMCFDSPPVHAFTFTPSFSFFVDCESEAQLRQFAAALGEGGTVMMAIGNHGFSRLFTWLSDRFGVSWQLNLP